jgi:hypothetical protein
MLRSCFEYRYSIRFNTEPIPEIHVPIYALHRECHYDHAQHCQQESLFCTNLPQTNNFSSADVDDLLPQDLGQRENDQSHCHS